MLAIPLSSKESTVISDLYGNAPFFALLDTETGTFTVVENEACGNGPKGATFLSGQGVHATVYYHMGEGVYKACVKNGLDVYTVGDSIMSLDEIYMKTQSDELTKLDDGNYKTLLDPGHGSVCKCGCES
jgi:predicted Fe-Mo cluster-binding NifX family protein